MKRYLLLIFLFSLAISSCKKETGIQKETLHPLTGEKPAKKITVSNLAELYTAINDPLNAGATIELETGTYVLASSYPNAGRLELQEDMSLIGVPGHTDQVLIDASALPGTSFVPPNNFPAPRTGAIRLGKGQNTIAWLNVKGNAATQALSAIETDLTGQAPPQIRITHVKVSNARIGIDIRNVGIAGINRVIEVDLQDNEIADNQVQQGQGIEIQNANGASGAAIHVNLNGNYVHGNKVGLRAFTNNANGTSTNNGVITINSHADRFEDNGIGIFLVSGLSQVAPTTANNNSLYFEAHGTKVVDNNGTPPPLPEITPSCGIYAVAGLSVPGGSASNNQLSVAMWGCQFNANAGPDIIGFAAFSQSAMLAGTENHTGITLHGVSRKANVQATASIPADAGGTNTINITR